MKEIWKRIKNYPKYEVSSYGEVRNIRSKYIVEPTYNHKEDEVKIYLRNKFNRYNTIGLKRLVAEVFNGGTHDNCDVIQVDGDFYNFHADNLAWIKKKDIM